MPDDVQFNLDANPMIASLDKVVRHWMKYFDVTKDAIQASVRLNEENKLLVEGLVTFVREGQRAQLKIEQLGNTVLQTSANVKGLAQSLKELSTIKFAREAEKLGQRFIGSTRPLGTRYPTPTFEERFSYEQAVGRLKEFVIKEQVTAQQITQIHKELASGKIVAYTGWQRRAQQLILNVLNAEQKFGATARAEAQKTARQKIIEYQKVYRETIRQLNIQETLARRQAQEYRRVYRQTVKALGAQERFLAGINKEVEKLVLSWQSIFRLITVQLSHIALSNLIQSLRQGVSLASELSIKLSEVRTIDARGLGIETWSSELRKLSDAWGVEILDQVEAAYQTLSNQVAKGAETFLFLEEANRLAVTGVATTADAVNLLTATINAFNINIIETNDVAASLFKTVELGRVRIGEMANNFGRVAVPAHQLGLTLYELEAAISLVTIQGIKYDEAATLIRNVLLKLIKPTKEMKGFFRDLGVTSGEAAIKAYGFSEVMRLIEERTRGSSTEIGELFGRIRAITGAMVFSRENVEKYSEIILENQKAHETYGERTALVMESLGKRLEIEINKIKNYFIVDLGRGFLKSLASISNGFESLQWVVSGFITTIKQAAIPAIASLIIALRKLWITLLTSPIFWVIVGAVSLQKILARYVFTIDDITRANIKEYDTWLRLQRDKEREIHRQEAAYLKAVEDGIRKREQSTFQTIARTNKYLNEQADIQEKTYENITEAIKDSNRELLKEIRDNVRELESAYRKLQREVEQGTKDIANIGKETAKTFFGWELQQAEKPQQKIALINERIRQLQQEAKLAVGSDDLTELKALRQETRRLIEDKFQILQKEAEEKERKFDLTNLQEELNELTKQYAKYQQDILDSLQKQSKELEGQIKGQKQRERDIESAITKYEKFSLTEALGLSDERQVKAVFQSQVDAIKAIIILEKDAGLSNENRVKQFEKEITTLRRIEENKLNQLRINAAQESYGLDVAKLRNEQKQLIENEKLKRTYDDRRLQLFKQLETLKPLAPFATRPYKESMVPFLEGFMFPLTGVVGGSYRGGLNLYQNILHLLETRQPTAANVALITSRIQELEQLFESRKGLAGMPDIFEIAPILDNLRSTLQEYRDAFIAAKGYEDPNFIKIRIEKLEQSIDNQETFLKSMGVDIIRKDLGISMDKMSTAAESMANAVGQLINFLKNPRASGGMISRGTDTVPAMLTPGEFVVNRHSAQRFHSQLLAINSGLRPQYLAQGGDVVDVGGINVTVQGEKTPELTAQKIASTLNRGLRQGTIRLGRR